MVGLALILKGRDEIIDSSPTPADDTVIGVGDGGVGGGPSPIALVEGEGFLLAATLTPVAQLLFPFRSSD